MCVPKFSHVPLYSRYHDFPEFPELLGTPEIFICPVFSGISETNRTHETLRVHIRGNNCDIRSITTVTFVALQRRHS